MESEKTVSWRPVVPGHDAVVGVIVFDLVIAVSGESDAREIRNKF